MYYTQLRIDSSRFRFCSFPKYSAGRAHAQHVVGADAHIGPANIWNHRRIRRWPVISTAGCFALSLRGNCFRWERCLHAGGAVVQFCREIPVCWPQCSSTGYFCGTAVQSDSFPAPLFAHFFWQGRKSGSAKQRLRCYRKRGSPVNPDKRADAHIGPYRRLQKTNRAGSVVRPYKLPCKTPPDTA